MHKASSKSRQQGWQSLAMAIIQKFKPMSKQKKSIAKIVLLLLGGLLVLTGLVWGQVFYASAQTLGTPLYPLEMNEARFAKDVVIGDLGGVTERAHSINSQEVQ